MTTAPCLVTRLRLYQFRNYAETTVRFGRDAPAMLRDIARLRGRWNSGLYASNALAALAMQDYWPDASASGDAHT